MSRPLVGVFGDADYLVQVADELEYMGWKMRPGWKNPNDTYMFKHETVCWGILENAEQAMAALSAAVRGAGIVALVSLLPDELAEDFIEDLRHIGPIEIRERGKDIPGVLSKEHRKLVELLSRGNSIGQAAEKLFISRRTAERRVAEIRIALQVKTTAEALVAVKSSRWPRPPQ